VPPPTLPAVKCGTPGVDVRTNCVIWGDNVVACTGKYLDRVGGGEGCKLLFKNSVHIPTHRKLWNSETRMSKSCGMYTYRCYLRGLRRRELKKFSLFLTKFW
jgi:hypothetical protein